MLENLVNKELENIDNELIEKIEEVFYIAMIAEDNYTKLMDFFDFKDRDQDYIDSFIFENTRRAIQNIQHYYKPIEVSYPKVAYDKFEKPIEFKLGWIYEKVSGDLCTLTPTEEGYKILNGFRQIRDLPDIKEEMSKYKNYFKQLA